MATEAGYRTGHYTSPHLQAVEERLSIDGRPISPARLGDLLARFVDLEPTYFEALTVAAFLWFAEEEIDLAVIEVGLGGRLDATNLCEPILSLITSISLEHQEFLGDTLAAIAKEKAGVFRPGRPALVWIEEEEPAGAVRSVAAALGTDLHFAAGLVRIEPGETDWKGQRVHLTTALTTPAHSYDLRIALLGAHQQRNLALAVLAAETLAAGGFPRLDADAIVRGAAACRWPGRLEAVELPGGRHLLFDAAHNAEGAAALAGFLAPLGRPVDLLFGVLTDKAAGEMLGLLAPYARSLILTTPPSPRAQDPAALVPLVPPSLPSIVVEPDPERALDRLLALEGEVAVVCGSIYLVGALSGALRTRVSPA